MDKDTTARLDSIVEAEIARGFRIREVPADVQRALKELGMEPPQRIRLVALNPSRRRDINKEVQHRYHKDLKDPEVLSNAQILKLVAERGEWTDDEEKRLKDLEEQTTRSMMQLWSDGYADDGSHWTREVLDASLHLKELVEKDEAVSREEKDRTHQIFDRWCSFDKSRLTEEQYVQAATEQGLPAYSPDRDFAELGNRCPTVEAVDFLNTIEDLRHKQQQLTELYKARLELHQLTAKHARIFSGSAESRQQHAEQLAQVYFTCDVLNAEGKPAGKLTPTFDGLWEFPEEAVRWLLYEAYFFHNDVPDEGREYLQTFGFMKADRPSEERNGVVAPSAESPAPPDSSDASVPPEPVLPSTDTALATT